MYRHLKVTSLAQMNSEIIKFLANLLGVSANVDTIKILSKNGNQVMWFVKDPARGGFAVWVGDNTELISGYPWENDSTVGVAGKYRLDMWRKEVDEGETAKAKSELREQNEKGYTVLMAEAETPLDMRDATITRYQNNLKIDKDIEVYEDKCHRVDATNPCHVGGLLKWSDVSSTYGFKWLDCLYCDNSFMFSLYNSGIPNSTRNLVIGEIEVYHADTSGRTYFMSNSWILKSYVNDNFFLEDIVGENRIPQQQIAIAMGENKILDSSVDNYDDKKREEARIKSELDSKEIEWKNKSELAESKREDCESAKRRADVARADAEQETDPDEKIRKEAWADELEASANRLDEEANTLEAEADSAEQEYWDLYADYDVAKRETKAAYESVKDLYLNTFTPTLQEVPSKEGNYNHHTANCPAIDEVITYNNEIFCAYRLDVDADSTGDAIYKDRGHYTAFHLHTAPKDLHLHYYDTSERYYPEESLTSPRVVGWEHQILHYTYESYESDVGVNIYPLLDTIKKSYDKYDSIVDYYKTFQCFSRSGNGGNSVNNVNNISTAIPTIFYVQRDDDENGDTWSATGHTDIVNYINMYNMSTGTMFHPQQIDAGVLFGCYNLWKRRMEATFWNPVINDEDKQWTEAWGFGGYVGIAFKTQIKDDFTELRNRVVE